MFSLEFPMLLQETYISFKNIAGCMLLKYIAMPAFSPNFNSWKKSRAFEFRVWMLSLQIYNFISVSQTQIGEKADNLNNVENYFPAGNYRQVTVQNKWGMKLPKRFWQNKFNVTYYKLNVGRNNEFCCFY